MACSHRQDSHILLNDDEPAIFVDHLHIAALELVVLLGLAHGNLCTRVKLIVELRRHLSVHLDAATLQRSLDLRLRPFQMSQQPFEQGCFLLDYIVVVTIGIVRITLHREME